MGTVPPAPLSTCFGKISRSKQDLPAWNIKGNLKSITFGESKEALSLQNVLYLATAEIFPAWDPKKSVAFRFLAKSMFSFLQMFCNRVTQNAANGIRVCPQDSSPLWRS